MQSALRQPEDSLSGILVIGEAVCWHPATMQRLVAASRHAHAFILDLPTLEEGQAQEWIARHARALFQQELEPSAPPKPGEAAAAHPSHPYAGSWPTGSWAIGQLAVRHRLLLRLPTGSGRRTHRIPGHQDRGWDDAPSGAA